MSNVLGSALNAYELEQVTEVFTEIAHVQDDIQRVVPERFEHSPWEPLDKLEASSHEVPPKRLETTSSISGGRGSSFSLLP